MHTYQNELIDMIMDRIRTLSGSLGIPPYALQAFSLGDLSLPEPVLRQTTGFRDLIGMYIWEDYHVYEMEDYLCHGTEYLKLDYIGRQQFLADQNEAFSKPGAMTEWKLRHLYVALGIASVTIRRQHLSFKLAEHKLLSSVTPYLPSINKLILTELLLVGDPQSQNGIDPPKKQSLAKNIENQ